MKKRFIILMFVILFLLLLHPQLSESFSIKTVNDQGTGVICQIFSLDGKNVESWVGKTGNDGLATVECPCIYGIRLVAKPVSVQYFKAQRICPIDSEPVTIIISSKSQVDALLIKADEAYADGDFKTAAFIYNEAHERIMLSDSIKASEIKRKIYLSAGNIFNVPDPIAVTKSHKHPLMSPMLKDAIKDYQQSNALKKTGVLGYSTLKSLSGMNSFDILFNDKL